jgi:uncharacterized membrane protein
MVSILRLSNDLDDLGYPYFRKPPYIPHFIHRLSIIFPTVACWFVVPLLTISFLAATKGTKCVCVCPAIIQNHLDMAIPAIPCRSSEEVVFINHITWVEFILMIWYLLII